MATAQNDAQISQQLLFKTNLIHNPIQVLQHMETTAIAQDQYMV